MSRSLATNFTAAGAQFPKANAAADVFDAADVQVLAEGVDRHTHAAGLGLPVARIAAGVADTTALADLGVTTAKLADLGVTTGKVAPGAISQRQLVTMTAASTTTSTSSVAVPGSQVNLTTEGGIVLLLAIGTVSNGTAGQYVQLSLAVDGTSQGAFTLAMSGIAGQLMPFALMLSVQPAAGLHAFSVLWAVSAGTGTLTAGTLHAVEIKR